MTEKTLSEKEILEKLDALLLRLEKAIVGNNYSPTPSLELMVKSLEDIVRESETLSITDLIKSNIEKIIDLQDEIKEKDDTIEDLENERDAEVEDLQQQLNDSQEEASELENKIEELEAIVNGK